MPETITYPLLKTGIKIGIATALAIILFQVSNIFLVYRYFKFDYYITGIAILFLVVGFFISKQNNRLIPEAKTGTDPLLTLTGKELLILQQIAAGKSNKEIASVNFVEVSTVKTHINNIYTKIDVKNRKEAIIKYGKVKVE